MAAQPDGQRQIEPQRADARQQGQDRPAASQRSDENGLRIESYADPRPVAAGTAAGVGSGLEVMRALLKRNIIGMAVLESDYRNGGGRRLQEAIGRKR